MANSINLSLKICVACCAELPNTEEFYGRHKRLQNGLNTICRKCNAQINKLIRRRKDGTLNEFEPEAIRNVHAHNEVILGTGFLRGTLNCLAHHTINHTQYKVVMDKNANGKLQIVLYDSDGDVAYTFLQHRKFDMEDFRNRVNRTLKADCIRLELNDVDLHQALKEIYFL